MDGSDPAGVVPRISVPPVTQVTQTEATGRADAAVRRRSRQRWSGLVVFALVGVIVVRMVSGGYGVGILNQMLVYAIVGVGFYLILGLSGQFAFSQAAVFGLGAYSSAWAGRYVGFWLSALFAIAVVALLCAVFSLILSRSTDLYFAIATLGLAQIILIVVQQWTDFSGLGGQTQVTGSPSIFGWSVNSLDRYSWLFLGGLVVALALASLVDHSPLRRETIAVRDRPEVVTGLGISVLRNRMVMFVVGSAYAAFAGSLFAHSQGFIAPESFGIDLGIDLFIIVILGGMFSVWGPVLGAVFVVGVPELARGAVEYRELVFSLILVAVILLAPRGFVGLAAQARDGVFRLTKKGRDRA